MRSVIKLLIFSIFLLFLLTAGTFVYNNVIDDYFSLNSSSPNSSVVYIENGVSGVVTIKDPMLNKTQKMNVEYLITAGSGVIVTRDGYIITAFHVIGDPQTLETDKRLKKMGNGDINRYVEQAAVTEYLSNFNPQLSQKLYSNSSVNLQNTDQTNFFIKNKLINVESARQIIKVKLPNNNVLYNNLDAKLIDVGNSNNHEDIALLKINYPPGNLHALSINSNNPSLGKNIRIFGYPAVNSFKLASSSGSVVGKMVNNDGVVYYETNAPTASGYSGGPALDNQNRILGIIIYGLQSKNQYRYETKSDYSLFLSSNYLIQICKRNNVPINVY